VPENKSLNILINTKYEGKGLTDLRKDFNDNKKTLDELRRTNQQTSDTYKNLVREQGHLSDSIRGLTREYKGLSAQQKQSKYQLLEFAENLTVVSAGLYAVSSRVKDFAVDSIKAGANLTVLRANFKGTQKDLELFGKATTGNLGEGALIKLSNRATDLGFVMKDQALLFDLAENASDAYGGSIEENFDRVVNAISKGGKGLEQLGISTNVFKERANELSLSLYGLAYKDLDAAEKRTIGFKTAILLTGGSLEKLNDKLPDVGDNIANLSRGWETFKEKLGEALIAQANFNDGQTDFSEKAGEAGKKIGEFIGFLSKMGGYIQTAETELFKLVVPYDKIYNAVQSVIDKTKELLGVQKEQTEGVRILTLEERVKAATDHITGNTIPTIGVTADVYKPPAGSRGSVSPEKEKEIKYITDKFAGLILYDIAKNVNALLPNSAYSVNGSAVSLPGLGNEPMFTGKIAPIEQELSKNFITVNNAIIDATHSLSAFFGVLAGGDSSNDGFKDFMKSIVNTFITSIEAMILASAAAMSGKAITTFGLSLFTDAPLLAAAFASLELARGIIGGLAGGGQAVEGRPYIVGEQGREMFVPNTTGQVINTMDLKNMMSGSSSSPTNIYINSEVDFIRFHKVMNAQVRTRRQDKIL